MNSNLLNWLWNGSGFEPAAGVPFSDRGLRYGMAVFETIRISDGRPEFWTEHMARIQAASQRCNIPIPKGSLEKSRSLFPLKNATGVLRIYITAGDGNPADPVLNPRIAVLFEERAAGQASPYALAVDPVLHTLVFEGVKTANYWRNADALARARAAGAHESLLLNHRGFVTGACMANAFIKIKGEWLTPPAEDGAREGVVREWVLRHFKVSARPISLDDLDAAEAAFLTNSWIGIIPANSIAGRLLDTAPAELSTLQELWNKRSTA